MTEAPASPAPRKYRRSQKNVEVARPVEPVSAEDNSCSGCRYPAAINIPNPYTPLTTEEIDREHIRYLAQELLKQTVSSRGGKIAETDADRAYGAAVRLSKLIRTDGQILKPQAASSLSPENLSVMAGFGEEMDD